MPVSSQVGLEGDRHRPDDERVDGGHALGASRVRKLFQQARQYAQAYGACLIFIDELEVVGKTRVFMDAFGGSSESNSTLKIGRAHV